MILFSYLTHKATSATCTEVKTDSCKDTATQIMCVVGLAASPTHPQASQWSQKVEMIDTSYFKDS